MRDRTLAVVFIAIRFLFCCYRAAHQSFVVDEALSFIRFIDGPWSNIYGPYDANNHVLYSILAKLCVQLFGPSEFALRLPSLLSGLALMIGVVALLRRLVKRPWIATAAVIVIGLNPVLLDFSIAARGYSLSVALFVWGVYAALTGRRALAGMLFGLAMGANLGIVFAVIGFAAAWLVLSDHPRLSAAAVILSIAALVTAAIYAPLLGFIVTHRNFFYSGYAAFGDAVLFLILASIHTKVEHGYEGLYGSYHAAQIIQWIFLPLVAAFIFYAAWRDRSRLIPAATLALTLAILAIAHITSATPYPAERAWLYMLVLAGASWAIACDTIANRPSIAINTALAVILAAQFLTQWQSEYFGVWAADRDMKLMAQRIQAETLGRPANSIALSSTWVHQPALEFYRRRLRITALRPVERLDPTPLSGFQYYVLSGADIEKGKQAGLVGMIYPDLESGALLARAPQN